MLQAAVLEKGQGEQVACLLVRMFSQMRHADSSDSRMDCAHFRPVVQQASDTERCLPVLAHSCVHLSRRPSNQSGTAEAREAHRTGAHSV